MTVWSFVLSSCFISEFTQITVLLKNSSKTYKYDIYNIVKMQFWECRVCANNKGSAVRAKSPLMSPPD